MAVCEFSDVNRPDWELNSGTLAAGISTCFHACFHAWSYSDAAISLLQKACFSAEGGYFSTVSANELLERVKTLPPRERRRFFDGVREMESTIQLQSPPRSKRPIRWPDAAARRRRIFGDKTLPNLVLMARELERY